MSFDHYFFTTPSFMRGVARAVDVRGTLSREAVVISATPDEADQRALRSDLLLVQEDARVAAQSLGMNVATP